jgi:hypothetical protein
LNGIQAQAPYHLSTDSIVVAFTDASLAPGLPAIRVQPQSQVLCGYNVTLSLTVEADAGSGSISAYRWMRGGDTVATTTSGAYSVVISTGAEYMVEVTNSHGSSVVSAPAVVRVGGAETGAIGGFTTCTEGSPGSIGAIFVCTDNPGLIGW